MRGLSKTIAVVADGRLEKLLRTLNCDILCLQETKSGQLDLQENSALAPNFTSFFSFNASSGSYCGVATIVSDRIGTLSCVRTLGDGRSLLSIGCDVSLDEVNSEGRTLITDHGAFVLINVYCPATASGDEHRIAVKWAFHIALRRTVATLHAAGRRVVLVGDLNVSHRRIDHCDPDSWERMCGPFHRGIFRQWMDSLLAPKQVTEAALVAVKSYCSDAGTSAVMTAGGAAGKQLQLQHLSTRFSSASYSSSSSSSSQQLQQNNSRSSSSFLEDVQPAPPSMEHEQQYGSVFDRLYEGDEEDAEQEGGYDNDESVDGLSSLSSSSAVAAAFVTAVAGAFTPTSGAEVPLVDAFRAFHPKRLNAFTCWNTKTDARKTNYGTRLDYALVSQDIAGAGRGSTGTADSRHTDVSSLSSSGAQLHMSSSSSSASEIGALPVGNSCDTESSQQQQQQFFPLAPPPTPVLLLDCDIMQDFVGSDHCPVVLTLGIAAGDLPSGTALSSASSASLTSSSIITYSSSNSSTAATSSAAMSSSSASRVIRPHPESANAYASFSKRQSSLAGFFAAKTAPAPAAYTHATTGLLAAPTPSSSASVFGQLHGHVANSSSMSCEKRRSTPVDSGAEQEDEEVLIEESDERYSCADPTSAPLRSGHGSNANSAMHAGHNGGGGASAAKPAPPASSATTFKKRTKAPTMFDFGVKRSKPATVPSSSATEVVEIDSSQSEVEFEAAAASAVSSSGRMLNSITNSIAASSSCRSAAAAAPATSSGAAASTAVTGRPAVSTSSSLSSSSTSTSSSVWKNLLPGPPPTPLCKCGIPTVQRTVLKEGPNNGRCFYVCTKPDGLAGDPRARCEYFAWMDDVRKSKTSAPARK